MSRLAHSTRRWRNFAYVGVVLLLGLGARVAMQNDGKVTMMKNFEWTSSESAPRQYPVELVRADLRLADGTSYYVPDKRAVSHGWGEVGATHFVGDDKKAMPTSLDALWFSYVENRFYAVTAKLPADAMLAHFEAGLKSPEPDEQHVFDRIIFGFGPEGEGAIWLSGGGNRIRVATLQGRPVDANWTQVLDNPDMSRTEFIQMVLEEIMGAEGAARSLREGYVPGTWPRRQERIKWTLSIEGAKETTRLRLDGLNGEVLHFLQDISPVVPRDGYGIPRVIEIQWTGNGEQRRSATVTFDAEETLSAFEKLAAQEGPLTLVVQISETSNALAVALHTRDFTYDFEKAKVDLFSR